MTEKFLTVLNKDEVALGYLTNAKGVEIQERLNGEALLSFEIPFDTADARYLELEGYVKFNGQLYVIKSIEHSDDGRRDLVVRAVHVYIELVDEYIDRVIELFGNLNGSLQNVVSEVLRDTHFVAGTITSADVHDFTIYETNVLKALQEIAELWNIDLWFNNRAVHFGTRGEYRNVEIRYGKNLKSLNIPTSSENIITRLYVYGKDGLTIEGVNNGFKYLDSPYISNYKRPKCGEVRFNDIDDPNELLEKARQHLEKVDKPEVSYTVDFVYLSKLGYDVYDDVQIGDRVIITHAPFGIDRLSLRVVEYRYRPFEPGVGSVTLSNTKDSLVDVLVQLAKSKNTVAKALDKNGRIQSNKLDTAIQQATQAIRNAQTELEFTESNGILARDKNDSKRFVAYNSEGLGFTKDGTTYQNAFTHDGLVITKGTVGRLDADVIVIGGGTTFEDGYDPSSKETPDSAQAKADAAQAAAEAVAVAKAALAEENAIAHADGVISAEEQKRIEQAQQVLTDAQTYAETKANEAEAAAKVVANAAQGTANTAKTTADSALTKANNSVQKGEKFDDSVTIGAGKGISVYDAANILRVMLGQYAAGKYGLLVKDGEIYSATIRTSESGTYIGLEKDNRLVGMINNKKNFDIDLRSPNESKINFYKEGTHTGAIGFGFNNEYTYLQHSGTSGGALIYGGADSYLYLYKGGGAYCDVGGSLQEFYIHGSYRASGSKTAVVDTDNFGRRLLYSMESTEVRFIDQGIGVIENGEIKMPIDPIFLETIEPNTVETPYLIRLNKYDDLDLYISDIQNDHFVVKERNGKNGRFFWELSAIRKGYANERLEQFDRIDDDVLTSNWEDEFI